MNERMLRSECGEFSATFEAGITSVCRDMTIRLQK